MRKQNLAKNLYKVVKNTLIQIDEPKQQKKHKI